MVAVVVYQRSVGACAAVVVVIQLAEDRAVVAVVVAQRSVGACAAAAVVIPPWTRVLPAAALQRAWRRAVASLALPLAARPRVMVLAPGQRAQAVIVL